MVLFVVVFFIFLILYVNQNNSNVFMLFPVTSLNVKKRGCEPRTILAAHNK